MELKELEKKYEELGKEIERLKKEKDVTETDPIYLMSIEEYEKYKDRIPKFSSWWWLRSPGDYSYFAAYVNCSNDVYYRGSFVSSDTFGIRPVLNLNNIKNAEWSVIQTKSGEFYIEFCHILWREIDHNLYIAETPIATHQFDEKSNDYSTSEIRKFLLDWYEDRKDIRQ